MIPSKARPALWEFCHGRTRGAEGPLASEVARVLFASSGKTAHSLRESSTILLHAKKNSFHSCLARMKRRGLVAYTGHTYCITRLGSWLVIARTLSFSFIELCILALACCAGSRLEGARIEAGCTRALLDDIFKEYYSAEYIDSVFTSLRSKGFAARRFRRMLVVRRPVRQQLMDKYGAHLEALEQWIMDLKDREIEIFSEVMEKISSTNPPYDNIETSSVP